MLTLAGISFTGLEPLLIRDGPRPGRVRGFIEAGLTLTGNLDARHPVTRVLNIIFTDDGGLTKN